MRNIERFAIGEKVVIKKEHYGRLTSQGVYLFTKENPDAPYIVAEVVAREFDSYILKMPNKEFRTVNYGSGFNSLHDNSLLSYTSVLYNGIPD